MCISDSTIKRFGRGLSIQRKPCPDESVMLFNLEGDLDHGTFDVLDAAIRTALDSGCSRLVLDLSQIGDISPSGIDAIIQVLAEIHERGGGLVLLNPGPGVQEVLNTLESLNLTKPITTCDNIEDAIMFFYRNPLSNAIPYQM